MQLQSAVRTFLRFWQFNKLRNLQNFTITFLILTSELITFFLNMPILSD
jgi:hypothetical protein